MDNNNTISQTSAATDFDSSLTSNSPKSNFQLNADSIIMVIGVGGAGGNAVNHMQRMGIHGVNFVVCNTIVEYTNSDNELLCAVSTQVEIVQYLKAE